MDFKKYLIAFYFYYYNPKTGEKIKAKQYNLNLGYLKKKFDNKFEMRIYLDLNGLKLGKRLSPHPHYSETKCNIFEFEIT